MEQWGMEPEEKAARDVERVLAGLPGLAAAVELAVSTLDPEHRNLLRQTVQDRPARPGGPGPLLEQAVEHTSRPDGGRHDTGRPGSMDQHRPGDHLRHPRRPR
jgi:hypothetical protein